MTWSDFETRLFEMITDLPLKDGLDHRCTG